MTHGGHRRVAVGTVIVGLACFLVAALVLVPWHPVPGGTPPSVAPDSYFTAAQLAEAESLARWARLWSWSSLAVSLGLACWLGFGSLGARLVGRLPGPWWLAVPFAVAALAGVGRLATLPFAVLLHERYVDSGLSTQGMLPFLADVARSEAVTVVISSLVLLVLVGCARRWRRAWPAVTSVVLGSLVLCGSFAWPLLVEPMFNSFTPMPDGQLRQDIVELADREGVDIGEVLVADASRRTTTLNAYVSGLGGSRRVVVYDTLVESLPPDEALSVVAHELAHARHHDVLTGSLLGVAVTAVGIGVLGLLLGGSSGRRSMTDPRSVPRVLALAAVGMLLASPVQNTISRQIETRADVDALRVTGDATAFIEMQRQLALRSKADPTPPAWSHFWFGSHPTVLQRIAVGERLS